VSEPAATAAGHPRQWRAPGRRHRHPVLHHRVEVAVAVAHQIAGKEHLAERGHLVHREHPVEAEILDCDTGLLLVVVDQVRTRGVPLGADERRSHRLHECRTVRAVLEPKKQHPTEVTQWVTERAHLPVEHTGEFRRSPGREQHVVEFVITVDECVSAPRGRSRPATRRRSRLRAPRARRLSPRTPTRTARSSARPVAR